MKSHTRFSIPTRRSLLSRIKDWNNHASWHEFYNTYRGLVHGVARKEGLTDAEAEDVVQETFLCVAKAMPKFHYDPAVGSFKSYLLHTTRWRIADQFRKRQKGCESLDRNGTTRHKTSTAERVPDLSGYVLEEQYEKAWKQNLQEAALQRVKLVVKPKQYQAFFLYVIKARPMREVTAVLGVTPNQVSLAKLRITRLIAREVKRLEREIL